MPGLRVGWVHINVKLKNGGRARGLFILQRPQQRPKLQDNIETFKEVLPDIVKVKDANEGDNEVEQEKWIHCQACSYKSKKNIFFI